MEPRWFSSALLSVGALGPCVGYAQPPEQAPDTMEARVMACAPCHDGKGEGTNNVYFPRLAGKPAGYLTNQLLAFHTGRRHYPPMNYLLAYQSEDYLKKIADYFAAQRPPLPPPAIPDVSNEVLARGKSIVAHGDAAAGIPACSSCHGPHLTGMEPAIPGLLGLHASYISAQLGALNGGYPPGPAGNPMPYGMPPFAQSLSDDEVAAVVTYIRTAWGNRGAPVSARDANTLRSAPLD